MSASLAARANLTLLDSNYEAWKANLASVDSTWAAFFEGFEIGMERFAKRAPASASAISSAVLSEDVLAFRMKVTEMLMRFRSLGHTAAWLDPLSKAAPSVPELSMDALGSSDADLELEVNTQFYRKGTRMKLRTMLDELRRNPL